MEFRLRQRGDGAYMGKKNICIDVQSVKDEKLSAMVIGLSGSWMYNESGEY